MEKPAEQINDLNKLIAQGKALEGFEKYYHNHVVVQKNEPTTGKYTNRLRESASFHAVTKFRKAEALNISVDKNLTMVVWPFDYRAVREITSRFPSSKGKVTRSAERYSTADHDGTFFYPYN